MITCVRMDIIRLPSTEIIKNRRENMSFSEKVKHELCSKEPENGPE